ncbi:hypothetical protein B0A50_04822 [Salinomyces thailandicus]|uniref:Meiotically up-regulated gene 190 protein n=1 Tax=Salinomyces thailandicus TaxID=706561 RepID=A0A4U0TYT8_9PEZI|nr:hypothetical protein B0A50_04822 [Salinomyces thailandica]
MSGGGREDANNARRNYKAPYTPGNPIPTISKYREEKERRERKARGDVSPSRRRQARSTWDDYWQSESDDESSDADEHAAEDEQRPSSRRDEEEEKLEEDQGVDSDYSKAQQAEDTSQADTNAADPKARRKGMKKRKGEAAEREVTDPVTHLPVTIHDYTGNDLEDTPENDPPFGSTPRSATGLSNKNKSNKQLKRETKENRRVRKSMDDTFPPPNFDVFRGELMNIHKISIAAGLVGTIFVVISMLAVERMLARWASGLVLWLALASVTLGSVWFLIKAIQTWMQNRIDSYWEDEIWEATRKDGDRRANDHETETVTWLNSLLGSVWPLVNPDLFTSLADTLEDVMQASLPSFVQMVSVDDIGQGSENLRILGVRWLPTGAASRAIGEDGNLKSKEDSKQSSKDSTTSDGGDVNGGDDVNGPQKEEGGNGDGDDGAQKEMTQGMEAEEGDFINLEVAMAYRSRSRTSDFKDRSKDMHLYLAFYILGSIKVPIWVDIRGFVGTVRLRLQLSPDPPFFALCTLTFLGQPKVELSCTPLFKRALNIMDLPLISNFVQSSVDAAMAEYVSPKSLTLDLKDMLAGDDFKKDTNAQGVLVTFIKCGYDFKMGDADIPLIKDGGSDPYVTCSWAKFGKPLFSTRVLLSEMDPTWRERAFMLVSPEALNVDERLRVQLWDSDRFTADDDLGRIEMDLKHLMTDSETNGKMQERTDGFRALKAGEDMPGKLDWSVGYFSKVRIQGCQLRQQTFDPEVRSMEELERKVDENVRRKLREANIKEDRNPRDQSEFEQQKAQEMKSRQDAMMISAPPPEGYPSGIFSIVVHQITGLQVEQTSKQHAEKNSDDYEESEQGEGLPSAYCTVIINHKKVFKTRTKPANSKPFFNAGVERFIPDWRSAEVHVSVRDARLKEDDPLIGIVHLPLHDVFKNRSQTNNFYPLVGGIGYGRVRVSMVWRSVQLQAPPQDLGWSYGTLEVQSGVSAVDLPHNLKGVKLRFHTDIGYGKQYAHKHDGVWHGRKQRSLQLGVKRRYGSCLAIEFRHTGMIQDRTSAFCTLWLRDLVDEQEQELTLPIQKGNYKRAFATCAEQDGEKIGELKLKATFWSGLGRAHSEWASKDKNLQNVVEVLDCARDNQAAHQSAKQAGVVDQDDTSSSDNDSSDDEHGKPADTIGRPSESEDPVSSEVGDDRTNGESKKSKQNLVDTATHYKKHMKSEHRRHRGVMQWKTPRTFKHAATKAEAAGHSFTEIFKHHTREPGIETEV